MKNTIAIFVLLCGACAKQDLESEKQKLTTLIDDETRYAAAADLNNMEKCWINTDEATITIADMNGAQQVRGWTNIKSMMQQVQPFELKLKRDNYHFAIDDNVAFVSFDQHDNWGGSEERTTKETRMLKKIDGEWKIVDANVIGFSSYDTRKTASFHMPKEKLAVDPRTSFKNQSGLGGMYVGFVEVPAGADFTPMFKGLPQDMCPSPHWGYLLEGVLHIKYPDGKEDVVKAGEVFYWPAPHTGYAEKSTKFIDFSPEPEFEMVMDHIAEQMKASKVSSEK